jgi:hypothetical protein
LADSASVTKSSLGERFFYYSRRARTLCLDEDVTNMELHPDIFLAWMRLNAFPHFRELQAYTDYLSTTPRHADAFEALLRPATLTSLLINVNESLLSLSDATKHALIETCSRLEKLVVHDAGGMLDIDGDRGNCWFDLFEAIISKASHLHTLVLSMPIQYHHLDALATLPNLRHLHLSRQTDMMVVEDVAMAPTLPNAFLSLRTLRLEDDTSGARVVQYLLALGCSPHLRECELYASGQVSVDDVNAILCRLWTYQHLERLDVAVWQAAHFPRTVECLDGLLRGIRPLPRLESFSLALSMDSLEVPLSFRTAAFVLDQCPRLKALSVSTYSGYDRPKSPRDPLPPATSSLMEILCTRPHVEEPFLPLDAFGAHDCNPVLCIEPATWRELESDEATIFANDSLTVMCVSVEPLLAAPG